MTTETTLDDVAAAVYDLIAEVEKTRREIVSELQTVQAAVWDTMQT